MVLPWLHDMATRLHALHTHTISTAEKPDSRVACVACSLCSLCSRVAIKSSLLILVDSLKDLEDLVKEGPLDEVKWFCPSSQDVPIFQSHYEVNTTKMKIARV